MTFLEVSFSNRSDGSPVPIPRYAAISKRLSDLTPACAEFPEIVRHGAGSFAQQIAGRTFLGPAGEAVPWTEPAYAVGPMPSRARDLENVMWNAVLGGPGAVTRIVPNGAVVGVSDVTVRQLSASIGNGIVSTAPYFGFVTGGLENPRRIPAIARGVKRAKTTRNYKKEKQRYAMWWFLGLTWGFWMSDAQWQAGVSTPPKNLGVGKDVRRRLREVIRNYVISGQAVEGALPKDDSVRRAA